ARLRQRVLAAGLPGPVSPAVARADARRRGGRSAPWRRGGAGPGMIIVSGGKIAYDQIGFGFAPLPLGPAIAFYTVLDRSGPVWRWVTILLVLVGLRISLAAPGHG